MSEESKKENLEIEETENNEDVEYEVYEEELDAEDNARKVLLSLDEIEILTEEGLVEYAQKTEFAIDKLELSVIDDDNYQLYFDLKKQEKLLYKKIKLLNKEIKEKGFFDYVKPWMFIYAIFVVLLGIFPVNPFLPLMLMVELGKKGMTIDGALHNWLYVAYIAILLVPGYLTALLYRVKTRDSKLSRRAFCIILIVLTLLTAIGAVVFFMWAQ